MKFIRSFKNLNLMKISLPKFKLVLLAWLCFISIQSFSKCNGIGASCSLHPQNTLIGHTNSYPNLDLDLYITVNVGDSVRMVTQLDFTCPPFNSSNIWYYNDTIPLIGTTGFGWSQLIILPMPGIYKNMFSTVFTARIHISYATSFNEITPIRGLNIYPIPVTYNLNISFTSIKPSDYTITITNDLGSNIKEYSLSNVSGEMKQTFDLSQFTDGIYFLSIHNDEMIETRKILKIKGNSNW